MQGGGTRLGALFGIAVKLNLVQPPCGAAPAVPESPTAASGEGGSTGTTPKRTKSNVSFATPVVNGIREVGFRKGHPGSGFLLCSQQPTRRAGDIEDDVSEVTHLLGRPSQRGPAY